MDFLNPGVFSVGKSPTATTDTMSLVGETGDLSHEFFKMVQVLRQSKLSNLDEAETDSGVVKASVGDNSEDDRQPLKSLIDFMDAVESQVDHGKDKTAKALPMPELIKAFSDLLGFLKLLRDHLANGDEVELSKTTVENSYKIDQSDERIAASVSTEMGIKHISKPDLSEDTIEPSEIAVSIIEGIVRPVNSVDKIEASDALKTDIEGLASPVNAPEKSGERLEASDRSETDNAKTAMPLGGAPVELEGQVKARDLVGPDNDKTAGPPEPSVKSLEQITAIELVEFAQLLKDLNDLIASKKLSGTASPDPEKPPNNPYAEQTSGNASNYKNTFLTQELHPSEPSKPENRSGNLSQTEKGELVVEKPVMLDEFHSAYETKHTFQDSKSSTKLDHDVNSQLTDTSVKEERSSVVSTGQNLHKYNDSNEKSVLEEALAILHDFVSTLPLQKPEDLISVAESRQSKLIEAEKLLRSINFDDIVSETDSELEEAQIAVPERLSLKDNMAHGDEKMLLRGNFTGTTNQEPLDLQSLEMLAKSVLAESNKEARQYAAQITRTAFVAIPPAVSEKTFTFEVPILFADQEVVQKVGSPLHAPFALEKDMIVIPYEKNDARVGDQDMSCSPSNKNTAISELDTITLSSSTSNQFMKDGMGQIQLGSSVQLMDDVEKANSHSGSGDPEGSLTTGANTNFLMLGDADMSFEGEPNTSNTVESVAKVQAESGEAKNKEKANDVKYQNSLQFDSLSSNIAQSAQSNDQKPKDTPLHKAQDPDKMMNQLRNEHSAKPLGNASSENITTAQLVANAEEKETNLQLALQSKTTKSGRLPSNYKAININSLDATTPRPEKTSQKTGPLKAENLGTSKADKAAILFDNAQVGEKQLILKKAGLEQKSQVTEIDKQFFEPPQPKLDLMRLRNDDSSKPKIVIDFSTKAAAAIMSHGQSQTREKNLSGPNSVPFALMNAEASLLQQPSSVIANNNAGVQTHTGSEGVEKWIDKQLELTARGWVNNLAKTMVSAINRGQQQLILSLSPPSLGRINIVFNAKPAGLDLRVHAERKATLSLLGDAETKLVSNLENAGHRVNNLSYAAMSSGDVNFDLSYNQDTNSGNENAEGRDKSEQENVGDTEKVDVVAESKADTSLVNITV